MASYEQIGKKKLWSVRFREIGTDGREHNARLSGFRTKKEAERAYLERTQMIERKRYARESTVYDDVIAEYLRDREQDVKESVLYDLEHKIARHITPYFTGKDLARISERDIMDWRAALLQKGMTKAYLQNVNSRLGSILRFASARYRIDNQPDAPIERSPQHRPETRDADIDAGTVLPCYAVRDKQRTPRPVSLALRDRVP